MTKRKHSIRSWLPACLLFLTGAPVLALDSVTLQLKWLHAFQFAGYYTAIAQGYYRDAGLEVRIREAVPGEDPMQHVLDGTAEFGVGDSGILLRRYKGDPFVVLGVVFQHSALALVALKQSPTQTIHNLAGKTLMLMQNDAELYA
jgi:ABC-type nitrate/sulfonate/bicarbonate transport system substrate-binding protein